MDRRSGQGANLPARLWIEAEEKGSEKDWKKRIARIFWRKAKLIKESDIPESFSIRADKQIDTFDVVHRKGKSTFIS